MIKKLILLILKFRFVIFFFLAILLIICGRSLLNLRIDNSLDVWFEKDDPELVYLHKYIDKFENDELVMIAYHDQNGVFTTENLKLIADLTSKLEKIPEVIDVLSINNVEYIQGREEELLIEPLIGDIPDEPEKLSAIKELALNNPLYRGNLVSDDAKITMILVRIKKLNVQDKSRLVKKIKNIVQLSETAGRNFYLVGLPVMDVEFDYRSSKDSLTFLPICLMLILIILLILFRGILSVLLPFGVVIMSLVFTLGFYAMTGQTFNMAAAILPPLIAAICIADSVHIINKYYEEINKGKDKIEAITEAVEKMFIPCLFTSITTSVGFASFVAGEIRAVKIVGVYAAIGIMWAFVITMVWIPGMLSILKKPEKKALEMEKRGILVFFLSKLANYNERHPYQIAILTLIVILSSIFAITQITMENMPLLFFRKNNPMRKAFEFIEDHFGGTATYEIMLEGKENELKNPEVLKAMEKLQDYILKYTPATKTISIVDYLKEINKVLHQNDPAYFRVPDSKEEVAQYLFLFELSGGRELFEYVTQDFAEGRIHCRSKTVGSELAIKVQNQIQDYIDQNLPQLPPVHFTGTSSVYVRLDQLLLKSQLWSFLLAFVIIFLLMCLLLRSIKLGVISIIPTLIPIALTLGIMGIVKIPLDVATIMIAGVALGICVDNAIHYMVRFKREMETDFNYIQAMKRTHISVGQALISTSIILFSGFFVLILGSFKPTVFFGVMTGITMIFALFGSLLLLPILLRYLKAYG